MKKFVLVGMLFLMLATSLDAAPRNRRRARRRRAATTQPIRYSSNNYYNNVVVAESPPFTTDQVAQQTRAVTPAPELPKVKPAPIVLASGPAVVPVVVADQAISEQATSVPANTSVPELGDALPTEELVASASTAPQAAPSYVAPAVEIQAVPVNSALAELNTIRRRRGLFPFLEDRGLTAIAYRKASIQANRGSMGHPGGTMGGARYEGVGMGSQFTTCYQDSRSSRYAGAATVVGRNGRRYHCLLLR